MVAHGAKIVQFFNVAKMSDTILVLILITMMRQHAKGYEQKVKFLGAMNPARFPVLSKMVKSGADDRSKRKGL